MSVVYVYKWNETKEYLENLTLFAVLVCTFKSVKLFIDLTFQYLFLSFIVFFLNFRKLEQRKLSPINIMILSTVMILFFITFIESLFIFCLLIFYTSPEVDNTFYRYVQLIVFNVFYIKDFIITLMLSYLYYYKGKQ